ncbi:MAG: aminotransferase class I/II-fold pyridoxal phosphate-dependent enzyme [Nannocystaceae bacterium]
MPGSLDRRLEQKLGRLQQQGLARGVPRLSNISGPRYHLDDAPVVGFCSNDFLGLAGRTLDPNGPPPRTGATGSRLICGDYPQLRDLEARLAAHVDLPDAVVFPSGYQLNVGALPALLQPADRAYSDANNHASLIDGLRLAQARCEILPHLHPPPATRDLPASGLDWWVTESTFSMDGDQPDPTELAAYTAAGGHLYLDEAHSLGLYRGGRSFAAAHSLSPTALVGTLSKCFGVSGAFLAGSTSVCKWLRTRARSLVFSTGISPLVVEAAAHALELIQGPEGDRRRARLQAHIHQLATELEIASHPATPIFPLAVGPNRLAVQFSQQLRAAGFHVQAIRPPTVPEGTARLRITLSAAHEPDEVGRLAAAVRAVYRRAGVPLRLAARLHHTTPRHTPSAPPRTPANA